MGYATEQSVTLPQSVRNALSAHAVEAYPYECCGYITGTDDPATWAAHRCRNIQNELHARDPRQYPRDARTAYTIGPEDLRRIFEYDHPAERIIGIYHSHPDHEAYFSETDRREAEGLVDWLPPGMLYLVLSVIEAAVRDIKAFSWDERTRAFHERPVEAG